RRTMNPLAAYKENAVTTQSKGKMVVLLYDGAIRFLKQALGSIQEGDVARRNELIQKAEAIIDELDFSLNMEAGGELAENLRRLYDFMRRHLIAGNIHNDGQRIQEVISILAELSSGWRAIAG
ncbi:MAG: flagellar export chaperone FliS, partial [Planctomycetota bacterium]|nr:flagellar export chaperone FliS [Planctomycetota bacterium]